MRRCFRRPVNQAKMLRKVGTSTDDLHLHTYFSIPLSLPAFSSLYFTVSPSLPVSHQLVLYAVIYLFSLIFSQTTRLHKLFQTCFPILFASFSPCQCLGQGTCQATGACLLSLSACCPVVAATFWHCTHVKGGEIVRERHGEKGEGQRRKARKQGNACRCRAYLVYKYANTVAFVICK